MTQKKHLENQGKYITIVGSINADITTYVRDFPARNQTILARTASLTVGGKGLNQAVAARTAGAQINFIAAIGNDAFGEMAQNYLTENKINTAYIKTMEGITTGTASIMVSEKGDNMIVVATGANDHLSPNDIIAHKAVIQSGTIVIVQLEIPLETVRATLVAAGEAGVTTILNPAPASPAARKLLQLADFITPNETETDEIVGIYPKDAKSAQTACEKLRRYGSQNIIITMGEKGYYIAVDGKESLENPFQVDAVDPTGAGDVFNGILAAALARGMEAFPSARYAAAAAALSVMKPGAQEAAPSWTEIEEFIRDYTQKKKGKR